MHPQPPTPVVRAFLVCRELFQDINTQEFILVGPGGDAFANQFPCVIPAKTFVLMTGLHGRYHFRTEVRDLDDHVVWGQHAGKPFDMPDPLAVCRIAFHQITMYIPRPGKYDVVLLANDTEIARTPVWAKIRQPPPPKPTPPPS